MDKLTFDDLPDDMILTHEEYVIVKSNSTFKSNLLYDKTIVLPQNKHSLNTKIHGLKKIMCLKCVTLKTNDFAFRDRYIFDYLKQFQGKQIDCLSIEPNYNETVLTSFVHIASLFKQIFINELNIQRKYSYTWDAIITLVHVPSLQVLCIDGKFIDTGVPTSVEKSSIRVLECHISGSTPQQTQDFYKGILNLCPNIWHLFIETRHFRSALLALVKSKHARRNLEKLTICIYDTLTDRIVLLLIWCLQRLPSTYHVVFYLHVSTDTALHLLLQKLSTLPTIRHVMITVSSKVIRDTLEPLILPRESFIQHLHLSWRVVTHDEANAVEPLVSQSMMFDRLKTFRLVPQPTSQWLIPQSFNTSYDTLKELCILQKLHTDSLYKLITAISKNNHLNILKLHGNFDFSEECPIIECPIEKLYLQQSEVSSGKHIFNVTQRIAFPLYLWHIDLTFFNVDLSTDAHIVSLSQFTSAEYLKLTMLHQLTDVGSRHFSSELRHLTELRFFLLCANCGAREHSIDFLSTLVHMPKLSRFATNISMNDDRICRYMATHVLPTHPSLTIIQNQQAYISWAMDLRCSKRIMHIQHNKYQKTVRLLELLFDAMHKPFNVTPKLH